MRRTTTAKTNRTRRLPAATAAAPIGHGALAPSFVVVVGAWLLWITVMLLGVAEANAEPVQVLTAPAAIAAEAAEPIEAPGELAGTPPVDVPVGGPAPVDLDVLLVVPVVGSAWLPETRADASIAAAVERGSDGYTRIPSKFRKRSTDLFRMESPVTIAQQDMLIRLRLRPKRRETMSVELRF